MSNDSSTSSSSDDAIDKVVVSATSENSGLDNEDNNTNTNANAQTFNATLPLKPPKSKAPKVASSSTIEAPSSPSIIPIPTRMEIVYDLNGSFGFAIGSSGFILAMYFTNWLPYFRYGSITWIWGCVAYSIPLLLKLKRGNSNKINTNTGAGGGASSEDPKGEHTTFKCSWDIGDLGEFLCYLFYIIGCILGGFFDESTVEDFLPAINHMFVYGSFSLALEPLYQAMLFLGRSGSFAERLRATKLLGDINYNNAGVKGTTATTTSTSTLLPPLKFNWDRCIELCAMTFFCAAGLFGGFPPHPSLALPGVYFWEVGSCFSVARSLLMIRGRMQGLEGLERAASACNSDRV